MVCYFVFILCLSVRLYLCLLVYCVYEPHNNNNNHLSSSTTELGPYNSYNH